MPDFVESLQGKDLGHLHIIGRLWGAELREQEPQAVVLELKRQLMTPPMLEKMVASLDVAARAALDDLCLHAGRLPWPQFTRAYGEVRQVGAARRDREQLYEHPASAVESLWYRGLLGRAFFDSPAGPEEFAYIPDDLLRLMSPSNAGVTAWLGRPASALEYARVFPASDRLLDHACTYLAALRMGLNPPDAFQAAAGEGLTSACLKTILSAAGLLDQRGHPRPEPVRQFLEAARGLALAALFSSWKMSKQVNELRLLPELAFEGKWQNDSLRARQAVLEWVSAVKPGIWWSLGSFVSAIQQRFPDFQRPAGDYDSWFIKDKASGQYLRGFEHWDAVDGRLVRFLVVGPLYWMGFLDLACPAEAESVSAFRLSAWSQALLKGEAPPGLPQETAPLVVRSDGRISLRRYVPRSVRYQLARFCTWVKDTPDEYLYQLTPGSLKRAQGQGLTVGQLVSLLSRYSKAMPPSLLKALERWDKQGTEVRLHPMLVLRVSSGEILQALRSSRAGRFLGEPLGPAAIAIKPGAMDKVLGALAELGYLGEIREEEE